MRALAPAPAPDGPLAALVDTILHAFCLGETFAVPLFAAMRPATTQPTAAAALQRILRDEATHRAFGWDTLDALLELDPAGGFLPVPSPGEVELEEEVPPLGAAMQSPAAAVVAITSRLELKTGIVPRTNGVNFFAGCKHKNSPQPSFGWQT